MDERDCREPPDTANLATIHIHKLSEIIGKALDIYQLSVYDKIHHYERHSG
jgi:hypothetical protein